MKRKLIALAAAVLAGGSYAMTGAAWAQDKAPATQVSPKQVEAQVQQSIDKAVAFLKAQQKPDGGWAGEKEPPAITALVLRALVGTDGITAKEDWVKKGYDKLLTFQLESGGIYKDALANYNTAISVTALAAAEDGQYKDQVNKAVAYLRSLQWTDKLTGPKGETLKDDKDHRYGGFGYGSKSRPDLSNLQMAMEALHEAGVKPDDPAYKAAVKFLERTQNRSESNDQPWAGDDGGFVYSTHDGGESMAGTYTDPSGAKRVRSYGSMTYAGLKSMIYAGLDKSDPRVKAAWEWIGKNWTLDENPGMRAGNPDSAKHGMFYYYLTMARALHAYGEPAITDPQGNKHDWRVELAAKLASLQKDDGSWAGEKRWMEDNPVLATSYLLIALEEIQRDLKARPVK